MFYFVFPFDRIELNDLNRCKDVENAQGMPFLSHQFSFIDIDSWSLYKNEDILYEKILFEIKIVLQENTYVNFRTFILDESG